MQTSNIPKIIHQLWIGPKERPSKFMDTWKKNNPDFEYIFWNEEEIKKRNLKLQCVNQINLMQEINGKADIIRWEILYNYGGIFLDADSVSIAPLDDHLLSTKAFASFENETSRKGLVATVAMGFPKNHPLCLSAINWILKNNVVSQRAWQTVGPGLITRLYKSFPDITIFPSYYFLPIHFSGNVYMGHGKVYAHQEWGSTKNKYNIMNTLELPSIFKTPEKRSISILVCSYNTNIKYIRECLESIIYQNGHILLELIWINDGSTEENTKLLEEELDNFKLRTRFCNIIYKKMESNKGVSYCLNEGVTLCSNEIIFRMDSDDIMIPNRILIQLEFMKNNPECVICGSNVQYFSVNENDKYIFTKKTQHPYKLTWNEYAKTKSHWFMNHPTLCFKKSAVLEVGNYNKIDRTICEDLELELKIMKKYGKIYNIPECLVLYRIHNDQLTFNGKSNTQFWKDYRDNMISSLLIN
mgnify:FL=1